MHSAVVANSVMQSITAAPSAPSPTSRSAPTRTPFSSTIASGRPVVVVCRVRTTPSAPPLHDEHAGTARGPVGGAAGGRHQDGVGHEGRRDAGLGAREHPRAVGLSGRRGGRLGPARQDHLSHEFGHGGGEDRLATCHTGEPRLALRVGAEAVEGQRAVDHRLDDWDVRRRAARRLHDQTGRHEVETGAPHVLAQVDAEQAGVGQLLPELAVERPVIAGRGLDLLQPLVRRPLAEDLPGQLADSLLLFAVTEVHGISWLLGGLSAATAACRGRRSR